MEIRNPRGPELSELIDMISAAFAYNKDEGSVAEDFPQLYDSSNSRHLWIAKDGSGLLGHSGFYPAILKVENLPLPVAGIGGVFTRPGAEGQGVASQLVKKCAEEARKSGAALALLWSDKQDFYGKLGFHLVGRQWNILLKAAEAEKLRAKGESSLPGLRLEEAKPTADFLAQSHAWLGRYPIGPARDAVEHGRLLGSGACRLFAAWAGTELAAYFVVGKGKDLAGYVHEWAGEEAALHQLAAHCLTQLGDLQVLSPQFMPDEVSWIYALDEFGLAMRAEQMALVRLLDLSKVQRLLADYLRQLGLNPDELRIQRHAGEGEPGYHLIWRQEMPWDLSEADLLRFLFGPELPQHPELKAFLPLRLWYWGMDSV